MKVIKKIIIVSIFFASSALQGVIARITHLRHAKTGNNVFLFHDMHIDRSDCMLGSEQAQQCAKVARTLKAPILGEFRYDLRHEDNKYQQLAHNELQDIWHQMIDPEGPDAVRPSGRADVIHASSFLLNLMYYCTEYDIPYKNVDCRQMDFDTLDTLKVTPSLYVMHLLKVMVSLQKECLEIIATLQNPHEKRILSLFCQGVINKCCLNGAPWIQLFGGKNISFNELFAQQKQAKHDLELPAFPEHELLLLDLKCILELLKLKDQKLVFICVGDWHALLLEQFLCTSWGFQKIRHGPEIDYMKVTDEQLLNNLVNIPSYFRGLVQQGIIQMPPEHQKVNGSQHNVSVNVRKV